MNTASFTHTDEGDQTLLVKVDGDRLEVWLTIPGKSVTTTYVTTVDAAEFATWMADTAAQTANASKPAHSTTVAVGFPAVGDEKTYWGTCSCGWSGNTWKNRELAQDSANAHFAFAGLPS